MDWSAKHQLSARFAPEGPGSLEEFAAVASALAE
jgi:hypothetical protein